MEGHKCVQSDRINRLEEDVRDLRRALNGKMDNTNQSLTGLHEKVDQNIASLRDKIDTSLKEVWKELDSLSVVSITNKLKVGLIVAVITVLGSAVSTVVIAYLLKKWGMS
jgi:ElaB/YqjD/DUF883 family membrane-anchored ribosome-binding protein